MMPKVYRLLVKDYLVYEKNYYVEANSKKEAVEKFNDNCWFDSDPVNADSGSYIEKSVVTKVDPYRPPTLNSLEISRVFQNKEEQ